MRILGEKRMKMNRFFSSFLSSIALLSSGRSAFFFYTGSVSANFQWRMV